MIVQSYNTILSLSHTLASSTGLLAVLNDRVHGTCVNMLGIPRPSFRDMNTVIAQQLATALLPAEVGPLQPFALPSRRTSDLDTFNPYTSNLSALTTYATALSSLNPTSMDNLMPMFDSARSVSPTYSSTSRSSINLTDAISHVFCHPTYKISGVHVMPLVRPISSPITIILFDLFVWRHVLVYVLLEIINVAFCFISHLFILLYF